MLQWWCWEFRALSFNREPSRLGGNSSYVLFFIGKNVFDQNGMAFYSVPVKLPRADWSHSLTANSSSSLSFKQELKMSIVGSDKGRPYESFSAVQRIL